MSGADSVIDVVVGIITRHPMSQDELDQTLTRWAPGHAHELLDSLTDSGRVQVVVRGGKRFWHRSCSYFPDAD